MIEVTIRIQVRLWNIFKERLWFMYTKLKSFYDTVTKVNFVSVRMHYNLI